MGLCLPSKILEFNSQWNDGSDQRKLKGFMSLVMRVNCVFSDESEFMSLVMRVNSCL